LVGFGAEKVEAELRSLWPETKIWRLDRDQESSAAKTKDTIEAFYRSPGAILIGTELALFHLHAKIENIAVVSIDSYFALPEFRISEKIFNILLRLRQLTLKNFLIQTRDSGERILELALKGNTADFQHQELSERKKLKYPPFSTLLKISTRAGNAALTQALETLKDEHLSDYQTVIYDSVNKLGSGTDTWTNLLLRLPAGAWPDSKLNELLRQLPPAFFINVDPENLF
jgi:primosomal protein N' (replication factor Y)